HGFHLGEVAAPTIDPFDVWIKLQYIYIRVEMSHDHRRNGALAAVALFNALVVPGFDHTEIEVVVVSEWRAFVVSNRGRSCRIARLQIHVGLVEVRLPRDEHAIGELMYFVALSAERYKLRRAHR